VRLRAKGYSLVDDDALEGFFGVYVSDPFGNRIELMEPLKSFSSLMILSLS